MSSRPKILVAGALSILQDLSNGSNIPALQPLVSVAVRIYTSAEYWITEFPEKIDLTPDPLERLTRSEVPK
ncbi:hypothetical protein C8F04DRAFT_1406345 [Mycena alexandri]|uniref:Uncharacterized protein n=1 Tax=Mycena alexandri TaxID=1745969 RepID=A0AAD6RX81_9AGAR|nr:hypothetical protein C8F04DRAFT_1406345 [Mycena alexandri]